MTNNDLGPEKHHSLTDGKRPSTSSAEMVENLVDSCNNNSVDQIDKVIIHKKRNVGRYQAKGRGISVDDANKNAHKKYLSHVSQNQSLVTKVQ